jgi:hypothetical protein
MVIVGTNIFNFKNSTSLNFKANGRSRHPTFHLFYFFLLVRIRIPERGARPLQGVDVAPAAGHLREGARFDETQIRPKKFSDSFCLHPRIMNKIESINIMGNMRTYFEPT